MQLSLKTPTWKERNWRLLRKRHGNSHGRARAVQRSALQATVQVRECSLMRSRWSSEPLFISTDEAGVLCTQPKIGREGHTCHGKGFCCLQLISCTPSGFFQRYQRQFDAIRVFPHERRKASILVGSGFPFPAKLVAGLVRAWRQPLVADVGGISGPSRGNHTHVSSRQRSKT